MMVKRYANNSSNQVVVVAMTMMGFTTIEATVTKWQYLERIGLPMPPHRP
jgi:hypothetical protein